MSERVRGATTGLWLAPALVGLGCNAILGIDSGHPQAKDGGDDDVAIIEADTSDALVPLSDAQVDRSTGNEGGECTAHWPARPAVDDDPMGTGAPIVLAVETIQLNNEPGKELGLDLDGRCTCPDVSACLLNGMPLDKTCQQAPGGRDIVGNFLLGQVAAKEASFSQASLQARLDAGAASTLLRISDYNGRANDQAVTLELFGKAWMPQPDGGTQPTPRKDGTDTWTVYVDTVGFGSEAIQRDVLAYVNNHTLVAHLLDATIAMRPHTSVNDNPLVVELHDAILTGTLASTDRGFRLESATLAGRWPSDRILKSFGTLADVGGSICGSNTSYLLLKFGVCSTQDVAGKQADDTGQSPCNAVSFGFGFTAGPAQIATKVESPTIEPSSCGDDWNPTCD